MKKNLLFMILLTNWYFLSAATLPNPDCKLWLAQKTAFKINERFSLKMEVNERLFSKISACEELYFDGGVDYSPVNYFVLGGRYRFVIAEPGSESQKIEHRIHLNPEFKYTVGALSFALRNRFELRMFKDETRLRLTERLKVGVKTPFLFNKKALAYISDELYFPLYPEPDFNNCEFHFGYEMPVKNNFTVDIYYGLEIKKKEIHFEQINHIVGIDIGFKLER